MTFSRCRTRLTHTKLVPRMARGIRVGDIQWFSRARGRLLLSFTPMPLLRIVGPILLCLLVAACSQGADRQPASVTASSPSASATWRAVYLGSDGHVKFAPLTSSQTVTGPTLPGLTFNGLVIASAGISPNGRLVAYSAADGLHVIDLTGRQDMSHVPPISAQEVLWAPDSTRLALGDGQGHIGVVNVLSGAYTHIPTPNQTGLAGIIGWVDTSHLAVTLTHASDIDPAQPVATSLSVGILDVSSWSIHTVTTITSSSTGMPRFALSPDGVRLLFFNKQFVGAPYTPQADEIDMATGMVTALPAITAAMGSYSGFTSVAWRSDGHTVAATTGFIENHDLKMWLLDLGQDSAMRIQAPHARYVMGWAPDNGLLVLSSGWDAVTNRGPYEIAAASVDAQGIAHPILLTRDAMTFPFLGFARAT